MSVQEQDQFIKELRAAITINEDGSGASLNETFLVECFTKRMEKPFRVRMGSPRSRTNSGLEYEEIGWDGTPKTCGTFGHKLIGDRMETAVSAFAAFISAIQGRRYILDHNTIELRIAPELNFSSYGRSAKFYARLVSYNSAEIKSKTHQLETT